MQDLFAPIKAHKPPSKLNRLYRIWCTMKSRCNNPNHGDYMWYGAKGVNVCSEWSLSFKEFEQWANDNGYKDDLTIDREIGALGYNPNNCRWVTMAEQNRNKSKTPQRHGLCRKKKKKSAAVMSFQPEVFVLMKYQ